MRNRNYYSPSSERLTQIDVGQTHVTVRETSGRVLTARILEKKMDGSGRVTSVLLDRLVHERHARIDGWVASGCFVTELVPKKGSDS